MSANPVPKKESGESVATIPDLNALLGRLQALRSELYKQIYGHLLKHSLI